jgi:tetratricopeptide (TPR) repeat protein
MAEREFGPDHSNVAASLNNLAILYFVQMQYSQARPLYKRALEIWINALGSKHPDVATGLENLAELQRKTRQDKEAESLEKRAATIRAMQR